MLIVNSKTLPGPRDRSSDGAGSSKLVETSENTYWAGPWRPCHAIPTIILRDHAGLLHCHITSLVIYRASRRLPRKFPWEAP